MPLRYDRLVAAVRRGLAAAVCRAERRVPCCAAPCSFAHCASGRIIWTVPKIEIDPETYDVRADGELLVCEPSDKLPMAQRCFSF